MRSRARGSCKNDSLSYNQDNFCEVKAEKTSEKLCVSSEKLCAAFLRNHAPNNIGAGHS